MAQQRRLTRSDRVPPSPIAEDVATIVLMPNVPTHLRIEVPSSSAPKHRDIAEATEFDFRPIQERYLKILQDLTDDAFFELDDDECSLPSSPNSPSSTSGVSLPLPPKSAPPCPITSQQPTIACQNGDIVSLSTTTTPTLHCDDLLHTCRIIPATSAAMVAVAECRLQQSLSTPCEDPTTIRKDSEYRRFKSEGSSAGANLPQGGPDVPIEELSPIVDQRRSTTRFSLMQQDSVVHPAPITKHSHTEQVTMMHTLKTKLSKYQSFVDRAFELIMQSSDEKVIEVHLKRINL